MNRIRRVRQRIRNRAAAMIAILEGKFKADKYNAPWKMSANPRASDPIYFIGGGDQVVNGQVVKGRLKPKYRKWKPWNWYAVD